LQKFIDNNSLSLYKGMSVAPFDPLHMGLTLIGEA